MRLLCTGDLHIGKIVNGFSMLDDQTYILEEIKKILVDKQCDALIIAGDVYDRSIPSIEAVELLDNFLTSVIMDLKTDVFMISGNHDSKERLQFASSLLKKEGLHIVSDTGFESIVFEKNNERVHLTLLPFILPTEVRLKYDVDVKTYQDAIEHVLKQVDYKDDMKNICVHHGFVTGQKPLEESDSERGISVGTAGHVSFSAFKKFDYTILGHIHRPQAVLKGRAKYTGSPLKYSVSEVTQEKSVTLIDVSENITVTEYPLTPKRDMRVLTGFIDDLMTSRSDDYVHVVLKDKGELYEPMQRLRNNYPFIMSLEREAREFKSLEHKALESTSLLDMFDEFYELLTEETLSEEEKTFLESIEEEVKS